MTEIIPQPKLWTLRELKLHYLSSSASAFSGLERETHLYVEKDESL